MLTEATLDLAAATKHTYESLEVLRRAGELGAALAAMSPRERTAVAVVIAERTGAEMTATVARLMRDHPEAYAAAVSETSPVQVDEPTYASIKATWQAGELGARWAALTPRERVAWSVVMAERNGKSVEWNHDELSRRAGVQAEAQAEAQAAALLVERAAQARYDSAQAEAWRALPVFERRAAVASVEAQAARDAVKAILEEMAEAGDRHARKALGYWDGVSWRWTADGDLLIERVGGSVHRFAADGSYQGKARAGSWAHAVADAYGRMRRRNNEAAWAA